MPSSHALLSRRRRVAAVHRHAVEALARREYHVAERNPAIAGKARPVRATDGMHAPGTNTMAWRACRRAAMRLGRVILSWWSYRQVARELYGLSERGLRDLRVTPGDIADIAWSEARLRAAESERPLVIGTAALLIMAAAAVLFLALALNASRARQVQRPVPKHGGAVAALMPPIVRPQEAGTAPVKFARANANPAEACVFTRAA